MEVHFFIAAAVVVCMPRKCHIFMIKNRKQKSGEYKDFSNHLRIVTRCYATPFSILSSSNKRPFPGVPSWHIELKKDNKEVKTISNRHGKSKIHYVCLLYV